MWPFAHKLKGKIQIKLSDLKSKSIIPGPFKMEIESKRMVPEYDITIKLRQPISEKEYKTVSKPALKITKIYPAFDFESETSTQIKEEPIVQVKTETKTEVKEIKKSEVKAKVEVHHQEPKKVEEKIDKSLFSELDLKDPENIELLNTLKVLEHKLSKVDNDIKKVEGRIPSNLRQAKLQTSVKKNKLMEAMKNGEISIQDYLLVAKGQLERDIKLAKYFQQNGEDAKKEIVLERIKVLKAEIDSCEK